MNNKVAYNKIRRKLYGRKKDVISKPYKFPLNSWVCISISKHAFQKDYDAKWSEEAFQVNSRKKLGGFNLFELRDLNNKKIIGHFYEFELQKIAKPSVFRIERILKTNKKTVQII